MGMAAWLLALDNIIYNIERNPGVVTGLLSSSGHLRVCDSSLFTMEIFSTAPEIERLLPYALPYW